ncbi:bifunctional aminoglycoside phosphotransferase/ATP-binding protein [Rhodococcoides corynebacterioides]|uniref:bifunctional aminoglycoside phosphotransferase/ATP-binding protein n=1 Tax=Rhodococcoides corynebacterioides TaxID=53972 RepID=UPI0011148A35|nr:AAA family ATPase [Rhodococcus corynebacterioides]
MTTDDSPPTTEREMRPTPRTAPSAEGDERADLRETPTAYVVALGRTVYKLKKPVRTEFLDFSTLASRWEACTREVALNSRFAPDVYRGVAEVTDPYGGMGEPVVVMHRLPAARRLSTCAQSGDDLTDAVDGIAHAVAAVHGASARTERITSCGRLDSLRTRWRHNLAETATHAAGLVSDLELDEVASRVDTYLDGRGALFEERLRDGRIVDGHGDLLADDIFVLADGPRILDCLDFSDELRFVDGIDDIASLAMDLELHHRPGLAERLLRTYREIRRDDAPHSLVHHYIAYRAFMRAKVDCLAAEQNDPSAAASVHAHRALALDHLRAGTVGLLVVGGLPGSGKSTVATGLADRIDAVVVSSDVVRKELAGLPPDVPCRASVGLGLYSTSFTARTYAEMFRRARALLAAGTSVILDATFVEPHYLARASQIADRTHSRFLHLDCAVSRDVALARLARRTGGHSDADAAVYEDLADRARRHGAHDRAGAVVLDTDDSPSAVVVRAQGHWLHVRDDPGYIRPQVSGTTTSERSEP